MSRKRKPGVWAQTEGAEGYAIPTTAGTVITDAACPLGDTPGPAAHGHVMWFSEEDGCYRRVKVRVPLEMLGEFAQGPTSPPDLRPSQVAWVQRELMTDETLHALLRDKQPKRAPE